MKVTLDLKALVEAGKLTEAEADRLKHLSVQETGSLGANILFAFGAVAIVLGLGVLIPSPAMAIVLGAILFGLGLSIQISGDTKWSVFGQIAITIGALVMSGGFSWLFEGNLVANFVITVGLAAAAVVARSGLLAAVSVVALATTVGFAAAYWKVTDDTSISQPAITIAVLALVALALLLVSKRLGPELERVALIAARTAVLLINLAFLMGSLFGDTGAGIRAEVFSVVWAVALLAVGAWGVWSGRRWVVNTVAVFGVIHFFVQWFWHLGASALSIIGGGALLVAFGFGLRWFNQQRWAQRNESPSQGLQSP